MRAKTVKRDKARNRKINGRETRKMVTKYLGARMGKDEGKRLSHLLVLTLRYAASSTHVTCE
jgi:hypothetical protein